VKPDQPFVEVYVDDEEPAEDVLEFQVTETLVLRVPATIDDQRLANLVVRLAAC
jgi:hypothetical protein